MHQQKKVSQPCRSEVYLAPPNPIYTMPEKLDHVQAIYNLSLTAADTHLSHLKCLIFTMINLENMQPAREMGWVRHVWLTLF